MNFPYRLEARPTPSRAMQLAVPLIAAVLTLIIGFLIFTLVGQDPVRAMHGFFIEPLSNVNGWSELVLKASPLCLIALGLAVGYRANVWNIGAEGQMLLGGIVAALAVPVSLFPQVSFPRIRVDLDAGDRPAERMTIEVTQPVEESLRAS